MLFTKSFFTLVAAASMVAASPAGRAADDTVTCTVTATITPALPGVETLVADAVDDAVTASFPGSTVTSVSTAYSDGTYTSTIEVSNPAVPSTTLISVLDAVNVDVTVLGGSVSVSGGISNCS